MLQRYMQGNYDSIYFGIQASATDPALNPGFWMSSGNFHFWNPARRRRRPTGSAGSTSLMHRQQTTPELAERQRLFAEVQRIFIEELPAIYFVTPKVTLAVSARVANARPAPQLPQLLWSADTLAVATPAR